MIKKIIYDLFSIVLLTILIALMMLSVGILFFFIWLIGLADWILDKSSQYKK